jgi:hypothetical protein
MLKLPKLVDDLIGWYQFNHKLKLLHVELITKYMEKIKFQGKLNFYHPISEWKWILQHIDYSLDDVEWLCP